MDFDLSLPSDKGMQVPVAETHCHSYMYSKQKVTLHSYYYTFSGYW